MSFTENDRKVRSKRGKSFPSGGDYGGTALADAMSEALRAEFGLAPSSVKHVARLTHSNERAVRNWFDAKNGPSGENLVCLIQHSDAVFNTVLALAGRAPSLSEGSLASAREHLLSALKAIDGVRPH